MPVEQLIERRSRQKQEWAPISQCSFADLVLNLPEPRPVGLH
jgi:hypothetical protein